MLGALPGRNAGLRHGDPAGGRDHRSRPLHLRASSPSRIPVSIWPAALRSPARSSRAENGSGHLNGPIDDIQLRSWGIQLVDGRMPGFAAIVGAAQEQRGGRQASCASCRSRNILIFLSGNVNGRSIIHQLHGRRRRDGLRHLHRALRPRYDLGHLRAGLRHPLGPDLRRHEGRPGRGYPALQQVPRLRLRAGPGRGGRPEVRRRRGRHQLTASRSSPIPSSRRSCRPASPRYEHVISMPFNEIEGKDELEKAEKLVQKCDRGPRRQDQDDRSADPGALRLGLRGRGGAQEGHARRVRRQVQPGLRIPAHGRHGPGRGRQDRGHRPADSTICPTAAPWTWASWSR